MNKRSWIFGAIFIWSLTCAVVVAGLATRAEVPAPANGSNPPLGDGQAGVGPTANAPAANAPAIHVPAAPPVPASMPWEATFERAMERSRNEGKPVLVDFYTDWCSACKYLDAKVYTDKSLLAESNNWIVVKVNAEKRPDLATAYGVHSYPTVAFLQSDGKPMSVQEGAPEEASVFLQWMHEALGRFVPPAKV